MGKNIKLMPSCGSLQQSVWLQGASTLLTFWLRGRKNNRDWLLPLALDVMLKASDAGWGAGGNFCLAGGSGQRLGAPGRTGVRLWHGDPRLVGLGHGSKPRLQGSFPVLGLGRLFPCRKQRF